MRKFHIFISALNLACVFSFILLFLTDGDSTFRSVLSLISVIGGPIANLVAVIISFIVLLRYLIRLSQGNAKQFIKHEWLGVFNGAFVLLCWGVFIGYVNYAYPLH